MMGSPPSEIQHHGPNTAGANANYSSIQQFTRSNVIFGNVSDEREPKPIQRFFTTDYKSDKARVENHHDGTCQWVLDTKEYKHWFETASTMLHVVGNPGVGKTVLAKFLLRDLERAKKSKERTIYFFCNRRKESNNTAVSILRSLIHQCMIRAGSIWGTHIKNTYDGHGEGLYESFALLWDVFEAIMSDFQSDGWYCVLDALDSCEENERKPLLDNISNGFSVDSKIQNAKGRQMNLRLIITSRPCRELKSKISSLKNTGTLYFTDAEGKGVNEDDIVKYITDRVANLADYSNRRKESIKKILLDKAEGNFKWASCMINTLDNTTSLDDEDQMLNHPLPEMDTMFEELVMGVTCDRGVFLKWVTFAYRDLSVRELGIAVKIKTLTPCSASNMEATHNSLIVDRGALRIQKDRVFLVHSTMKRFMCSKLSKGEASEAHLKMAEACLIYLSSNDLDREPLEGTKKSDCREHYNDLLRKLPFLEYAASFWHQHLQDAGRAMSDQWDFVRESLDTKSKRELSFQIHQFSNRDEYVGGQSCLHILTHHGLTSLVKRCIETEAIAPNVVDSKGRTALWWAVEKNNEPIVTLLLGAKGINPNLKDNDDRTSPFLVAVKKGHIDMVKIFLRGKGISWTSEDKDGRTALSWAAGYGFEDIVCLLLANNDIRTRIDSSDHVSHQTPLLWAARKGHAKVVKLLLGKGASPNAISHEDNRSALSWAAGNGHEATVALLLERADTELNSRDKQEWTVFHWAAIAGYSQVARAILNERCKRSGSNWISDGEALLIEASTRGQDAELELLLERHEINPDSQKGRRTALSWAAERGHDKVVRQLLATTKVNVNSKDTQGRTPLMWAALQGRADVVKLLLGEDKIDLDAADISSRKTAIELATSHGYIPIATLIRGKQRERLLR